MNRVKLILLTALVAGTAWLAWEVVHAPGARGHGHALGYSVVCLFTIEWGSDQLIDPRLQSSIRESQLHAPGRSCRAFGEDTLIGREARLAAPGFPATSRCGFRPRAGRRNSTPTQGAEGLSIVHVSDLHFRRVLSGHSSSTSSIMPRLGCGSRPVHGRPDRSRRGDRLIFPRCRGSEAVEDLCNPREPRPDAPSRSDSRAS